MICCEKIENSWFNSNTYILSEKNETNVWLVDCGDFYKIEDWLQKYNKVLKGIFVTHSHFDHIYGINDALLLYPDINVFVSKNEGINIITDSKRNGSKYTEKPFEIHSNNFKELEDIDVIHLFSNNYSLIVYETMGHSVDSLSFAIDKYLFTGDAYIPGIKVVTKLKGGNKEQADNSIKRIISFMNKDTILCPGHNSNLTQSI